MPKRSRTRPERSARRAGRHQGRRAEQRGRGVPATLQGFEEVLDRRGPRAVGEAVVSRGNQRWQSLERSLKLLVGAHFPAAALLPSVDFGLDRVGVTWDEAPPDFSGSWLQRKRWSADSVAAISRYMTGAQSFGAVVIARQQLEMATLELERMQELSKGEDESTEDYVRRIWLPHASGGDLDAGRIMGALSDALHGRGPLLPLFKWEALDLLAEGARAEAIDLAQDVLGGATRLLLSHLRSVLIAAATRAGDHRALQVLTEVQSGIEVRGTLWSQVAVWPLTYGTLENPAVVRMEEGVRAYAEALQDGAFPRQEGTFLEFCIIQRRIRAVHVARMARDAEQEFFGENFRPETVEQLNVAASLTSELAVVLAGWLRQKPDADWLMVGACALKSGFWLWLEDDDRSMMAARSVLEMAARLRTLRLKPQRAHLLDTRGSRASNRDWFSAAGWGRMALLQKSLGELAHAKSSSNWSTAREALAEANVDYLEKGEDPLTRARGQTLSKARDAFAFEVLQVAQGLSLRIADVMRIQLDAYRGVTTEEDIEAWLSKLLDLKRR